MQIAQIGTTACMGNRNRFRRARHNANDPISLEKENKFVRQARCVRQRHGRLDGFTRFMKWAASAACTSKSGLSVDDSDPVPEQTNTRKSWPKTSRRPPGSR